MSTEYLDRLARQLKVGKNPACCRAINRILDWDKLCHAKARDGRCNLDKVAKMLYDMSQLNCLAAEDLVFVTRDKVLKTTIAKGRQANRVISWEAFLRSGKN